MAVAYIFSKFAPITDGLDDIHQQILELQNSYKCEIYGLNKSSSQNQIEYYDKVNFVLCNDSDTISDDEEEDENEIPLPPPEYRFVPSLDTLKVYVKDILTYRFKIKEPALLCEWLNTENNNQLNKKICEYLYEIQ